MPSLRSETQRWAQKVTSAVTSNAASDVADRAVAEMSLQLPERLDQPGLLVGWSLEAQRQKHPLGFGTGDPAKTPATGYIDPILMERDGHLITIAPTGAGKGIGCIVPALLRYEGPVIVVDPKGENVAITARRRREMGQTVVVLDPMGITDQPGAALNPLQFLDAEAATTVDEASAIANALIDKSGDDRNRFWYDRGIHFVTGAILHAVSDFPAEGRNLTTVRHALASAASDPDGYIAKMAASRHPEVRAIARSFDVSAKETRGSIISIAQDSVDFLRGPLVQQATSSTSFDLQDVTRGAPLSIFLVLPPHMLESHGKLLRLWISTLMSAITRRRGRAPTATLFLLDEAAQLGNLPQLRQAVTLLRGYGMRTWSFWQDLSQLRLLYPRDWQTMINNCAVVQCFGSFNSLAATDVAEVTGFGTPSSVVDLHEDEMVLQIRGDQAVRARRPNYREDPAFTGQFDQNPYYLPDPGPSAKANQRIRLFDREPTKPTAAAERPTAVAQPYEGDLIAALSDGWKPSRRR